MSQDTYEISIISFSRGAHPDTGEMLKPHWTFHINTLNTHTIFHELEGSAKNYRYNGAQKRILVKSDDVDKMVRIGSVPADKLDCVEELFENVEPRNSIEAGAWTEWGDYRGCRAWCLDALAPLREAGFLDGLVTPEFVKATLKPWWES